MALTRFHKDMNIIGALDDQPNDVGGLSAAALKAKFDEGGNAVQRYLNETLLPLLEQLGAETAVQYRGGGIRFLRLGEDRVIETSEDGVHWTASGSAGHIICDGQGKVLPQRSRMQFLNSTVQDSGQCTVIGGIRGERGERGAPGPAGPQGPQGEKGERGAAWYPSLDLLGTLTFTLQDTATPPPACSIRGPQGPQGIQGPQGAAGVRGPQGIQGPAGVQGVQGAQGDPGPVGATGAQGPAGPAGPQGPKGADGADGRSLTIQSRFDTLAALQAHHPTGTAGDAYAIGTAAKNEIYIWDTVRAEWTCVGALQGPAGPQGPVGPVGPQGPQGAAGPQGVQGSQGAAGRQGPEGPAGPQGLRGTAGADGKSAYDAAVECGFTGTETAFGQELARISQKADRKVPGAVGNLAALDAQGNLRDSGVRPAAFGPAPLTEKLTYYVDAVNGVDSNPGTQAAPFATLQRAIDVLPKCFCGGAADIYVAAGTYTTAVISGFYGSADALEAAIRIHGKVLTSAADMPDRVLTGGLMLQNCKVDVEISGFLVDGNQRGANIYAARCGTLLFSQLVMQDAASVGIWATLNRFVVAKACRISNKRTGISLTGGMMQASSISGSGNSTCFEVGNTGTGLTGMLFGSKNTIAGTKTLSKLAGGIAFDSGTIQ